MNRGMDNMSAPVSEQVRGESTGTSQVMPSGASLPAPLEELQRLREGELKAVLCGSSTNCPHCTVLSLALESLPF